MHTMHHPQLHHLQHTCSSIQKYVTQPVCHLGTTTAKQITRKRLHLQAHAQSDKVLYQRQEQQQHKQQQYQQEPAASKSSRRRLIAVAGAAAAASLAVQFVQPSASSAYIVDETVAQSVFALAARSVVSINDYKQQGGADVFEGVGTGFVWDKYGHSE
jgi:hypothetical protein